MLWKPEAMDLLSYFQKYNSKISIMVPDGLKLVLLEFKS
jgi:hypothetical protein